MATLPGIIINRLDADRLQRLIDRATDADRHVAEQLEDELERGEIVEPHEVPADVVSMNSRVEFTDLTRQQTLVRTLVYPHALADQENGLSVLAPLGAALLGLKVGSHIEWSLPDGSQRQVRIDALLYQPESAGDLHR
ncbi:MULTISPECIES: nucleoside diphosphate kinase regulator [Cobetia]|uniref:Nucleoside diphosphate kinase regulator n=1 Tax=Cobetia crustatorum TaxID=553385 RepID=A0A558HRV1_9GAMM|nr:MULTISPECIES: nucleoside diphosphate kinase regulator [Cobetia]TVU71863.1 nucleoside diphosphate kinase regulator [Cobetia crustatorum]